MTSIVLLDHAAGDRDADALAPISTARPLAEVRAGARLVRERWSAALGMPVRGVIAARRLTQFEEPGAAQILSDDVQLEAGTIVALSHFVPALDRVTCGDGDVVMAGDRAVAMRLTAPMRVQAVRDITPSGATALAELQGWWLDAPWDLIRHLPAMLAADTANIAAERPANALPADIRVIGPNPVRIAASAVVEPFVVFDTTNGAIIIDEGAHVRSFSRIAGPFVLGRNSQWMGGSGTCVSVGDNCRACGEMSVTIMCGHANKGHDGFVGHSYLGRWTNLGAGTVTSNLKNTYGPVQFAGRETGMQFLGSLLGDHAKTGILTRLTTGSCIGAGANVISDDVVKNVLPPFAWGASGDRYELSRFLQTAERVMARRQVELTPPMRECLTAVYHASTA